MMLGFIRRQRDSSYGSPFEINSNSDRPRVRVRGGGGVCGNSRKTPAWECS